MAGIEDVVHEIALAGAEQPARAHHAGPLGQGLQDGLLPGQTGLAVDIEGRRGVFFPPGAAVLARKDQPGTEVHQMAFPAGLEQAGQSMRQGAVVEQDFVGMVLGIVHRVPAKGAEHHVRRATVQTGLQEVRIQDVTVRAFQRFHRPAAPQQDMAQGLPQQSGAALQNQCFHEQSSKV